MINLKAGIVPVDAKFPLESFQRLSNVEEGEKTKHRREFERTVKLHIDSIANKYILPDEGTFDFALMYIPAENVYYEIIIKDEDLGNEKSILNYALERHVIPVSPNSFYAYLQAIAFGLKGLQVEKKAQEILNYIARLEGDYSKFKSEYDTLGGHIDRTSKKYDEAEKLLVRFESKLSRVHEPSEYKNQTSDDILPPGNIEE